MNDDVDTQVKINLLTSSNNDMIKWRSLMMSDMVTTESISNIGYQNKLRLLQQSLIF